MYMHAAATLAQHVHCKRNASVGGGQESQADPVSLAGKMAGGHLVVAFVPENDS